MVKYSHTFAYIEGQVTRPDLDVTRASVASGRSSLPHVILSALTQPSLMPGHNIPLSIAIWFMYL